MIKIHGSKSKIQFFDTITALSVQNKEYFSNKFLKHEKFDFIYFIARFSMSILSTFYLSHFCLLISTNIFVKCDLKIYLLSRIFTEVWKRSQCTLQFAHVVVTFRSHYELPSQLSRLNLLISAFAPLTLTRTQKAFRKWPLDQFTSLIIDEICTLTKLFLFLNIWKFSYYNEKSTFLKAHF